MDCYLLDDVSNPTPYSIHVDDSPLPALVVAPLLTERGTGRHCQSFSSYKHYLTRTHLRRHRDGFFVVREKSSWEKVSETAI
jgi:hypothetical protein